MNVISYSEETDAYGQKRQGAQTIRRVEMYCRIFSQVNIDNPKYVDIDVIGLTDDKNITDANQIVIDDDVYNVKYVIPSSRK